MRSVVFVAPYATANTLRYVEALLVLPGVRVSLLAAEDSARFPRPLCDRLAAFVHVEDVLKPEALAQGLRVIAARTGAPVDRVFGALEQLQLPIALARDLADVPGMGAQTVAGFRDKSVMKQRLRAAGVPCARYARVESPAALRRFAQDVGYPLILKPVDGLGTRSTYRIDDVDALEQVIAAVPLSTETPVQAEEFLVGSEHSFETVTINGDPVWSSSTNYIPGPLEVLNTPWIQYCVVLPRETDNLDRFRSTNHEALKALGMQTGLSHMEWFSRADGSVAVNEVGARPPGVNIMPLTSLAHGTDMVAAWVGLMALDTFQPVPRVAAAGTAFFRGQGRGARVVRIEGLERALEEVGPFVRELSRPHVGQARAAGYEGEGHAIVSAPTTQEVMHALAVLVRNVRVVLG